MKTLVVTSLLLIGTLVSSEIVEIKTGSGRTYYTPQTSQKLYVCYDRRVRVYDEGTMYLRYDGCARYVDSCRYNGKARFGRYPNSSSARRALNRCRTASPRFVD